VRSSPPYLQSRPSFICAVADDSISDRRFPSSALPRHNSGTESPLIPTALAQIFDVYHFKKYIGVLERATKFGTAFRENGRLARQVGKGLT
jgi:hypothetical protein